MKTSKTKKMVLNAILLGLGLVLHQIFPAIAGITPDVALVMLFCIMILNKDDYKTCLVAGIVTGVFTAMTTKFPGGQIPNLIDKTVTVNVMFLIMKALYLSPIEEKFGKKANSIVIFVMTLFGTVLSGVVFLGSAALIVGLPGEFFALFMAVVVPATIVNVILSVLMINVITASLKKTSFQLN